VVRIIWQLIAGCEKVPAAVPTWNVTAESSSYTDSDNCSYQENDHHKGDQKVTAVATWNVTARSSPAGGQTVEGGAPLLGV
jgi:hypothetical protein